jgi:hypothetical protein
MDGRTKPSELYTIDRNNNTSDEDNVENSYKTMNDIEGWGEDGIIAKLINITTSIDEHATTRNDVDG